MHKEQTAQRRRRKIVILATILSTLLIILLVHIWFHITNPYAAQSIVRQPYTTSVSSSGAISVKKEFDLQVTNNAVARGVGYYKSGFLIVQNAYFGSRQAPSANADDIIKDIHKLRFDPSKPYLISGDQFSVLYTRNLGVFYNSLLDPNTAHDQKDWENRQRIYLQSALYALDAFSSTNSLATTIVPTGPKSAVLTQVHPGSVASDTLYGLFYALHALQDTSRYKHDTYKLQTAEATKKIINQRRSDLGKLLSIYLGQVRDESTGMIKPKLDLASARDGVIRDRSFYDTLVLWKTLDLAKKLDIPAPSTDLAKMRASIINTYWDEKEGHFKDDLMQRGENANYSSDWLLALPTGFLNPANPTDQKLLTRSIEFIRKQGIAKPFPIKYQANNNEVDAPWAVKTFVPNYGGDAIWSYWGGQYITLLGQLGRETKDDAYIKEAKEAIATYNRKIENYRGFPETFDAKGAFLQNIVYKSIRQTGWVVQFEQAKFVVGEAEKASKL